MKFKKNRHSYKESEIESRSWYELFRYLYVGTSVELPTAEGSCDVMLT